MRWETAGVVRLFLPPLPIAVIRLTVRDAFGNPLRTPCIALKRWFSGKLHELWMLNRLLVLGHRGFHFSGELP